MAADGKEGFEDNNEKLLGIEAEAAVKEVAFAVDYVQISQVLPNNDDLVYLNLKTKEQQVYCVELSVQGFRVVSSQYDTNDETSASGYFETIYALLDNLSPEYRHSFGDALMSKLYRLQEQQEHNADKS